MDRLKLVNDLFENKVVLVALPEVLEQLLELSLRLTATITSVQFWEYCRKVYMRYGSNNCIYCSGLMSGFPNLPRWFM